MPDAKPFWQSKTFWINSVTLLVTALTWAAGSAVVPPSWQPVITAGLAVANILLRLITDQPLTLTKG